MLFKGKVGDDLRTGTAGADTFLMYKGGDDTVQGLAGDDVFKFSSAFTAADRIDGGGDHDKLILKGDYSAGVVLDAATLTDVEEIRLARGKDYALTSHDATVAAGDILQVNGFRMEAGDVLVFDGSAETDGEFWVTSGAGNDRLTGGDGGDVLRPGSGNDTADGGGGDDAINVTFFNESDSIVGGDGDDRLIITGNGIDDFVFMNADTLDSVETIVLRPGFDGQFVMHDANVAAGEELTVNGLDAAKLVFDGSAETDGRYVVSGSNGADTLIGGARKDKFNLTAGGDDNASGGGSADSFFMGGQLTGADTIDGGLGADTVYLDGLDATDVLQFFSNTMTGVDRLELADADYVGGFLTDDATVAAGAVLTVDAGALSGTHALKWTGTPETNGSFNVTGGAGTDELYGGDQDDTLAGGGGGDTLSGALGGDRMSGGGGADLYLYFSAAQSTGADRDVITDLDLDVDGIYLFINQPTAIDPAVNSGPLSESSFDAELAAAVGAFQLGVQHALIFTPDDGDLEGHAFLVIDRNGDAGYQAGADIVIEITGYTGALDTGDFPT
jgi:Ca2+-binding RTX toxin-like protein